MSEYQSPLRDTSFVMNEVLDMPKLWAELPGCEDATPDMVDAIVEALGQFCDGELAPMFRIGDEQGCTLKDGEVKTPDGFKEAYQLFVESGWPSLSSSVDYGGQGLPESLGMLMSEYLASSNWAWAMYSQLSHGAKECLEVHGSEELKQTYLTKLVEGSWTGTMCLTEPQAGSDLNILRTKAEDNGDGTYKVNGTKIFISAGEHDMAENIVHLVLARLPDAPAGTRGISIFVVPKFLPDTNGAVGERNGVTCGSLEHKMGIHGNSTCVMNFDDATGYLIGELNKGLNYMFTMMNSARLGVAMQGLGHMELGFQKALAYANDRLQMRSLTGPKNPDGVADPIIVHPDIRRMLLTAKSLAEGTRMLAHYCGKQLDISHYSQDENERKDADDILALLIPIAKGFMTEMGCEAANECMQVFGGHGYISEWGVEQNVRDCRISTIYEGTTGIQALDLLGRKVMGSKGELLKKFGAQVQGFIAANSGNEQMTEFLKPLGAAMEQWGGLAQDIGVRAAKNPDEIGDSSVDFLKFSGYVVTAYFWAQAVKVSLDALAGDTSEQDFYKAKLSTARFYFKRILPRIHGLAVIIEDGADTVMDLDAEHFRF